MDITTIIGNFGFPIVACIGMAIFCKDTTDKNRADVKELNKQHTDEMMIFKDEIKTALDNNTKALEKLCDRLDN